MNVALLKRILLIPFFLLSVVAHAQRADQLAPSELRAIQSRQFKTGDIEKVSRVVNDAMLQNQISGSMSGHVGSFSYQGKKLFDKSFSGCEKAIQGCRFSIQVFITQSNDKKYVITRIPIRVSGITANSYSDEILIDQDIYSLLYSAISKSLFIEAQAIEPKELN